jgi:glycerol-3-phosphate dehydrogenase subunit B
VDTFDVVVIGGGAAGSAAALSAVRAGASVALVHRGPGAAALSAGGWYEAPPADLRAALADAGHELIACDGALPHPDGVLVSCEVAGVSHARAALGPGAREVLVCGIAGLPSFRPAALAALWSDEAGLGDGAVQAGTITLDGTPAAGWSPAALAVLLDREPQRLAGAVAAIVRERRAERLILPAVLGLNAHARVLAAIADAAGVQAAEALGVAPSVPGWRLERALQRAVSDAGVRILSGRAVAGAARQWLMHSVRVEGPSGTLDIGARCFVLASGKYIGGGICAEAEFEEPALGCDVALERFARTIDDPGAALMLTDPVRTEPQPVLSAGVRVDADGRPLTPSGDVFLSNVFVAGSVRAGAETALLGLGGAAHEGSRAGERAAALASGARRT